MLHPGALRAPQEDIAEPDPENGLELLPSHLGKHWPQPVGEMEAIFVKSCQGVPVENKKGSYPKECGQGRGDAFREGGLSQDLKWGSV